MKLNTNKSQIMRIGHLFKVKCKPVILGNIPIEMVDSLKYLGNVILAAKHFKLSIGA